MAPPPVEETEDRMSTSGYLAVLASCSLAIAANVRAADVWVFTDHEHPVAGGAAVRVVELDAPQRLASELVPTLPADPGKAAAMLQQRLATVGAELRQRLITAYQGVTDAWSLGITKIPAVVVDRKFVIYGEQDVKRAVAQIEHYRSARK